MAHIVTSEDPEVCDKVNTRLLADIGDANTGTVGYDNYSIGSPNASDEE